MNLFRLDETKPADVIAELERRAVPIGAQEVIGLCPAAAAGVAASGRLLEGRLASAAAAAGARACDAMGGEERIRLATRLAAEAAALAELRVDQDAVLGGAERAAALLRVLAAAGVDDEEVASMLVIAARGLAVAVSEPTRALYAVRIEALERSLRFV